MKFCIYVYNVYIKAEKETETKLTDYEKPIKKIRSYKPRWDGRYYFGYKSRG